MYVIHAITHIVTLCQERPWTVKSGTTIDVISSTGIERRKLNLLEPFFKTDKTPPSLDLSMPNNDAINFSISL